MHEYLEEKRLTFTRFFFLNDSQFLDFLMLCNSNQDFSVYINLLFQGAHKLYITRMPPNEREPLTNAISSGKVDLISTGKVVV